MKKIKRTKIELKKQRDNLKRYNRFLPILYIKKQQIQMEIERIGMELLRIQEDLSKIMEDLLPWVGLFGENIDLSELIALKKVETKSENIAGVDIPVFVKAHIEMERYDLFIYPLWVDRAIETLRDVFVLQAKKKVYEEQKKLLSKELRMTSQRVNLFEKVKVPEAEEAIRQITIHLADQQVAAVGWSRMAKKKIQEIRP